MKLEKAIELLVRWQDGGDITSFTDVNVAVKLGIQALKRHQEFQNRTPKGMLMPLPGETP